MNINNINQLATKLMVIGKKKNFSHFDRNKPELPHVVADTLNFLRTTQANEVEGIFRISGQQKEIQQLKNIYASGKRTNFQNRSVHSVSGLLKLYLRELNDPLLTFELYESFISAMKFQERIEPLKEVLKLLPVGNLCVLQELFSFLASIVQNVAKSKMNEKNLAIVFHPTLLRSINESPESFLEDQKFGTELVITLLKHYEKIFNEPVVEIKLNDKEKEDFFRTLQHGTVRLAKALAAEQLINSPPPSISPVNSASPTSSPVTTPRRGNLPSTFLPSPLSTRSGRSHTVTQPPTSGAIENDLPVHSRDDSDVPQLTLETPSKPGEKKILFVETSPKSETHDNGQQKDRRTQVLRVAGGSGGAGAGRMNRQALFLRSSPLTESKSKLDISQLLLSPRDYDDQPRPDPDHTGFTVSDLDLPSLSEVSKKKKTRSNEKNKDKHHHEDQGDEQEKENDVEVEVEAEQYSGLVCDEYFKLLDRTEWAHELTDTLRMKHRSLTPNNQSNNKNNKNNSGSNIVKNNPLSGTENELDHFGRNPRQSLSINQICTIAKMRTNDSKLFSSDLLELIKHEQQSLPLSSSTSSSQSAAPELSSSTSSAIPTSKSLAKGTSIMSLRDLVKDLDTIEF